MAKVRRESGSCTGRSFSILGADGYMAHMLSFLIRPNANGTTNLCTPDYTTGNFNFTGHGLNTGDSVCLTGTTTPTGLVLSISIALPLTRANITEYYAIRISADVFKLSSSRYLAISGTALTFSDNGTNVSFTKLGGGANWYLWDDFSMLIPKNFATTDVNTSTDTITMTAHGFSGYHKVTFSSTVAVPGGLTAGTSYWLIVTDADHFKVASSEDNAYNATAIDITSQGTGTHTITTAEHFVIVTDTLNPVVNDYNTSPAGCAPKFLKLGYWISESGYCRMQGILWWDNVNHIGRQWFVGGYQSTYDSALFSYQFIGGDQFFFQATLLGATWSPQYIDTWTGFSSKLEPITKVGVLQGGVTSGSSVALTMAGGQGTNFTINNYYYLYDFVGHSWINYVKVTNVVGDVVTVDTISHNFPSGSVLTPYAHRYAMSAYYTSALPQNSKMCYSGSSAGVAVLIPYFSNQTTPAYAQTSTIPGSFPASIFIDLHFLIAVGIPDDLGYYDCVFAVISEYTAWSYSGNGNRIYGRMNDVIQTGRGTMGWMTNTRTLLGIDYLNYLTGSATPTEMITYSESAV